MFEADFWDDAQNGNLKKRNEILMHYQHLVDYAVKNVASGIPKYVPRDDLHSNGQFGLIEAIDRFEPSRGFKFETYAMARIKGSILDSLRSLDWVPRSVRSRERMIEQSSDELSHRLGRRPTMDEVMTHSGLEEHEILDTQSQVEHGQIYNLDMPIDYDSTQTVADTVASEIGGDLSELASIFDLDTMVNSILDLPQREYLTITLHYYLGETLAQIGTRFGVTESRVCQIHTRALRTIREGILL